MSAQAHSDVLPRLEDVTSGHAREAGEGDDVDGVEPVWVVSPADATETGAVLAYAHSLGLSVVARGSGTKMRWGAPPERVHLVLDLRRLDTLVDHAAGDLIVVAGAGMLVSDLQAQIGRAGQRLGVDPFRSGTLGGLVATATSGPTRLAYGAVRDLLIGSTMVRSDGVVARSGGRVVKNVAGYDLGKVLSGSFGTLGVLTEVAFRLHPVPPASRWVSALPDSADAAAELVQRLVHSHLVPAAVELDWPDGGPGTVAVLVEGIEAGVDPRAEAASQLLSEGAAGGREVTTSSQPPGWWGSEPGEPGSPGRALVKVTHELNGVGALLGATAAAAEASGLQVDVRGSAGVGVVWMSATGGSTFASAFPRFVTSLRHASASFGGAVVVLEADREATAGLDVWGPVTGLDLMRSVKHAFDPERRLAPGRFVGGI